MAMQVGLECFLFDYLATNQYGLDESLDFALLTPILAKRVTKANRTHNDGSSWCLCVITSS